MTAERIYRALLTLYPRGFRDEYGHEVVDAFRQLRQASRSPMRFWLLILSDSCRAAVLQRLDVSSDRELRFAIRWVGICALGAVACGSVGAVVTWAFRYFYHPFLEGMTIAPWMYGTLLGGGLGLVQLGMLRHWVQLRGAWVMASAIAAAVSFELAIATGHIAGPFASSLAFGTLVASAQWLVLRRRVRRAAWWVLPSGAALSILAIAGSAALERAIAGVTPIPPELLTVAVREPSGVHALLHALWAPASWTEFSYGAAMLAMMGLMIGGLTAKPVSSVMARSR